MRPTWHRCGTCYFALDGTDECLWCHFVPDPLETVENSMCSFWLCENCGGSWDDGDDHLNCVEISVELN